MNNNMDLVVLFARLWGQREVIVLSQEDMKTAKKLREYDSEELLTICRNMTDLYLAQDETEDCVEFFDKTIRGDLDVLITKAPEEEPCSKKQFRNFLDDHYIAWKLWCEDDVKSILEQEGYEPSDENACLVLNRLDTSILTNCTDSEWQAICDAVQDCSDDLQEIEDESNAEDEDDEEAVRKLAEKIMPDVKYDIDDFEPTDNQGYDMAGTAYYKGVSYPVYYTLVSRTLADMQVALCIAKQIIDKNQEEK